MKDIIGYEGLYVWDGENVIGLKRGKVLKWFYDRDGRPYVSLCKDGKQTNFYKHQLIWMDYHNQAISQGFEIHHIDGDFTNNAVENMQLLTKDEHLRLHAKTREICQKNNYRSQAVNCYKDGKILCTFKSIRETARQLGLYPSGISMVTNGKCKTYGGYTFSYA